MKNCVILSLISNIVPQNPFFNANYFNHYIKLNKTGHS